MEIFTMGSVVDYVRRRRAEREQNSSRDRQQYAKAIHSLATAAGEPNPKTMSAAARIAEQIGRDVESDLLQVAAYLDKQAALAEARKAVEFFAVEINKAGAELQKFMQTFEPQRQRLTNALDQARMAGHAHRLDAAGIEKELAEMRKREPTLLAAPGEFVEQSAGDGQ